MMLLSRTAENLYWLGRHLEHIESVARIVSEHTKLLIDLPVDVDSDWTPLLAITGTELSDARLREFGSEESAVINHLVADIANPTSLLRTASNARENLRVTRQLLPSQLWEAVNGLHALLVAESARCVSRTVRLDCAAQIIATTQRIAGMLIGSLSRDDSYRFIELGRTIERADMVTRVLDVRAAGLLAESAKPPVPPADRSPYEEVRWMGVLRSLDAQHTFIRTTTGPMNADSVVTFLVDDEAFPHSVAHCLGDAIHLLKSLPGSDELVTAATTLKITIGERPARPMEAASLRTWLDEAQQGICGLHLKVTERYFMLAPLEERPSRRQVVV